MSDADYDGHSDQFEEQDNQFRGGYVDDILDDDNELNEQAAPPTAEALNIDDCEEKVWLLKVSFSLFLGRSFGIVPKSLSGTCFPGR